MSRGERSRLELSRPPAGKKPAAKPEGGGRATLQRALANPAAASPQEIRALQRTVGNQAMSRLAAGRAGRGAIVQAKLVVGPASDPYEQEADRVADRVTRAPQPVAGAEGGPAQAAAPRVQRVAADSSAGIEAGAEMEGQLAAHKGGGSALPGETRSFMEPRFGADFSGVRVHTGPQATQLNRSIQAQAFTHGNDIYFGTGKYQPGTSAGNHLLAHELTHVVQQDGARGVAGAQRKPDLAGAQVRGRLPANRISTKRQKMHLDFVRMKRQNAEIAYEILDKLGLANKLGMGKKGEDSGTYGHWWTEVGDLRGTDFIPDESYGWWPKEKSPTGIKQLFGGVAGALNKEGPDSLHDPHEGERAQTEFHPVAEVDPQAETYEQIRLRIVGKIRDFVKSYKGKWHWKLGWGKNCHTFQQSLKSAVGLHYQSSKLWLRDPNPKERTPLPSKAGQREVREKLQEDAINMLMNTQDVNYVAGGAFATPAAFKALSEEARKALARMAKMPFETLNNAIEAL